MVRVEYKKHFTCGLLEGLTVTETMPFLLFSDAVTWADMVSKSDAVNYTVSDLKLAE